MATVLAALAAGLMLGRYAVPAGHPGPKYFGVDIEGVGTIYLPTRTEAAAFNAAFLDRANKSEAQANVRASIPAIEAYYADNNSYAGATLAYLQTTYDAGVKNITIQSAGSTTYCIESTAGAETWKKAGPGSDIITGACP